MMNVMVCEDCYISHHYGCREVEKDELQSAATASGFDPEAPELWWVGEGDRVVSDRPLGLLWGYHMFDNTDSESGEGIETFSMSRCSGCGSNLGGSRYCLAIKEVS